MRSKVLFYFSVAASGGGSAVQAGTATDSNVTVDGNAYTPIVSKEVTITLVGNSFKEMEEGDDVSSWFTNLPNGLKAEVAETVDSGVYKSHYHDKRHPDRGSHARYVDHHSWG
jgi:hypothetical protein